MNPKIIIPGFLFGFIILVASYSPEQIVFKPAEDGVFAVMQDLGYDKIGHFPNMNISGVSAKAGEQLIKDGVTKKFGKKTKKQSKHFVCTSCHNVEREDPDLKIVDPQARLDYTAQKGIPFLQGSSLYGSVNRETFYNDDYEKKYGDLVKAARYDIRGAIQLCAVECAQGRKLKPWEVESILAYMWSIEYKMSDLDLSKNEKEFIASALKNKADKDEAISLIKSKYLQRSPAHFVSPPEDRKVGTYAIANEKKGQLLYENSCLHCHENGRYSYLHLDKSKLTFKYLKSKAPGYSRKSIYHVVRYGIESYAGKESYMPKYPIEKMDVQQLDDLRSYIEKMAE